MNPPILSGVVSHVERRSEVSGYIYNGYGSIETRPTDTRFRVAGRPASCSGSPILNNGDKVHMVGSYRGGFFYVESMTNFSAGLVYGGVDWKESIFVYVFGIAALAFAGLCAAMIAFILGLFIVRGTTGFSGRRNPQLLIRDGGDDPTSPIHRDQADPKSASEKSSDAQISAALASGRYSGSGVWCR